MNISPCPEENKGHEASGGRGGGQQSWDKTGVGRTADTGVGTTAGPGGREGGRTRGREDDIDTELSQTQRPGHGEEEEQDPPISRPEVALDGPGRPSTPTPLTAGSGSGSSGPSVALEGRGPGRFTFPHEFLDAPLPFRVLAASLVHTRVGCGEQGGSPIPPKLEVWRLVSGR